MADIRRPKPNSIWPWGGPKFVRERLVDPSQVDRKRKAGKKGDPKNPALASSALLDFIGPAHSSDELRLPMPPMPPGHDADLAAMGDRPFLGEAILKGEGEVRMALEDALSRISVTNERADRLKLLLGREAQMLQLLGNIYDAMMEIQQRMREEQKAEGF